MSASTARTRTGQALSLVREYWGRRNSRMSWVLLGLTVALSLSGNLLMAWITDVRADFFDAMTARDAGAFRASVITTLYALAAITVSATVQYVATSVVTIEWRRAATHTFIGRWMRGHVAYRMERDRAIDAHDDVTRKRIEHELLARNPLYFRYFEVEERLAALTRGAA